DTRGDVVIALPIAFSIGGAEIPTKSEVVKDSTVLELTPEKPAGVNIGQQVVSPKPVLKDIASAQENQKAINDFSSKFSIGTAIGTFRHRRRRADRLRRHDPGRLHSRFDGRCRSRWNRRHDRHRWSDHGCDRLGAAAGAAGSGRHHRMGRQAEGSRGSGC
ncbi:MAG: hypothetical protein H5T78_12145, partial [Nocardia sp.]|nr:hypothetical protein [Nocardia sp.]